MSFMLRSVGGRSSEGGKLFPNQRIQRIPFIVNSLMNEDDPVLSLTRKAPRASPGFCVFPDAVVPATGHDLSLKIVDEPRIMVGRSSKALANG
jgi:hypothetical protein